MQYLFFLFQVSEQLTFKYGKEFAQQARSNTNQTVNERVCVIFSSLPYY